MHLNMLDAFSSYHFQHWVLASIASGNFSSLPSMSKSSWNLHLSFSHSVTCEFVHTLKTRHIDRLWAGISNSSSTFFSKKDEAKFVLVLCFQQQEPQENTPCTRFVTVLQNLIPNPCIQRIVRLGGAVDDDMANLIVAQLLYLDSADKRRDITMYVNSPGGSVTAGESHSHIHYKFWKKNELLKH